MTGKDKKEVQKELVKDPVCGMVKPKSKMPFKSEYKGKIYYSCTEGDKDMFVAYPEHWIPKEAQKGSGNNE